MRLNIQRLGTRVFWVDYTFDIYLTLANQLLLLLHFSPLGVYVPNNDCVGLGI